MTPTVTTMWRIKIFSFNCPNFFHVMGGLPMQVTQLPIRFTKNPTNENGIANLSQTWLFKELAKGSHSQTNRPRTTFNCKQGVWAIAFALALCGVRINCWGGGGARARFFGFFWTTHFIIYLFPQLTPTTHPHTELQAPPQNCKKVWKSVFCDIHVSDAR